MELNKYTCDDCGEEFETTELLDEEDEVLCSHCADELDEDDECGADEDLETEYDDEDESEDDDELEDSEDSEEDE